MSSFDAKDLGRYPTKSGVYLMKDLKKRVLYVGKAKNLRTRIRQYFMKSGDDRAMIPYLIKNTDSIDVIVVPTERDALLLESTLIKQHQPKYNALLKDDKRYVNIVLTRHEWPRLTIERHRKKAKDIRNTFGPYTNARVAREVLDLMNQIFPLRECSDQELIRRTRPCLLHGIKRCAAPCVSLCSKESYLDLVHSVRKLLQGKDQTILDALKREMQAASEELLFEKAASIRDMIEKIEQILSKQHVDNSAAKNCDVLALYREADHAVVAKLLFREHKLIGSEHFPFSGVLSHTEEILEMFLLQHYEKEEIPKEIFLPEQLENASLLEEILTETLGKKVRITSPQKGDKKALVRMAYDNAEAIFKKDQTGRENRDLVLLQLQETLSLPSLPRKIACFDSSHTQGENPVAVAVVFVDGKKEKELQRYFSLEQKGAPDDYASLKEALTRYCKQTEDLPDLIIIDGGKGHLNVATRTLAENNIVGIAVIGLAKEASLHTKGMTREKVHRPYEEPILLPKHSPVLFLLQRIRDEAHRVAISFHQKKRSKSRIKSRLETIPGIGPKKRALLLKQYGSMARIEEALNKEDSSLFTIKGITEKDLQNLREFFSKKDAL
ncbi:MAG: excinuclease ABC subunit UvrC [Chlamydiota bacterium]